MSELLPSDVSGVIIAGAFNDAKVEAATMYIVGYLDAHNATWDTEFSWHEFINWVVSDEAANYVSELYVSMLSMFGPQQLLVNQIHQIIGKYIARRDSDDNTYFKMTPELVDLVQRFAARRMANTPPRV